MSIPQDKIITKDYKQLLMHKEAMLRPEVWKPCEQDKLCI